MDDYDKSLDDIIRQRNIGIKRNAGGGKSSALSLKPQVKRLQTGMRSIGRPKFVTLSVGGGRLLKQQKPLVQDARQKLLMNQRLKVKDARETLLQKNRLVDARQKLNQKAKVVDAREKLNKLATQQTKTTVTKILQKQPVKPNPLDLTRTVSNRTNLRMTNNNTLLDKTKNIGKQVVLTDGGLKIIARSTQQKQAILSPPTSIFTRTVDSLAKDVYSQSGLVKKSTNILLKKRELSSDESDEESVGYITERIKAAPKRLRATSPLEAVEVNSGISSSLQSRLGKQHGNQQGYRLIVSNLHPFVTERDLEDLFGDIGPIYGAQILQGSVAEVVYHRLADAEKAVEVYHKRELDGKPMGVKLVNMSHSSPTSAAPIKSAGTVVPWGTLHSDNIQEVAAKSRITPDVGLFHKALFRSGTASTPAARTRAAFTVTM